ncbi:MAG: hypothetical protein MJA83_18420 [Gammaproteobacteria bacterium]|nr:hypothetical protein [Gammaproteobacteria bacterium]
MEAYKKSLVLILVFVMFAGSSTPVFSANLLSKKEERSISSINIVYVKPHVEFGIVKQNRSALAGYLLFGIGGVIAGAAMEQGPNKRKSKDLPRHVDDKYVEIAGKLNFTDAIFECVSNLPNKLAYMKDAKLNITTDAFSKMDERIFVHQSGRNSALFVKPAVGVKSGGKQFRLWLELHIFQKIPHPVKDYRYAARPLLNYILKYDQPIPKDFDIQGEDAVVINNRLNYWLKDDGANARAAFDTGMEAVCEDLTTVLSSEYGDSGPRKPMLNVKQVGVAAD